MDRADDRAAIALLWIALERTTDLPEGPGVDERVTPEGLDELSPRELEVLGLVARGSTNREIAETLVLSPLTVKTHVSRILTKLRARDRVQLVVIAYQAGLVSP